MGYVTSEGFSGGCALGHNGDLVIYQKAMRQLKRKVDGQEVSCGHTIKFEQKKIRCGGKTSMLYKSKEVDFDFGDGWDAVTGLLEVAIGKGLIIKGGGGWFTYPAFEQNKQGIPKLRGEENVREYFKIPENLKVLSDMLDAYELHKVRSSSEDEVMLEISTNLYNHVVDKTPYVGVEIESTKEEDY